MSEDKAEKPSAAATGGSPGPEAKPGEAPAGPQLARAVLEFAQTVREIRAAEVE